MKTFTVEIRSLSPMLQHEYPMAQASAETSPAKKRRKPLPREEAERATHRDEDGHIYHPSLSIKRAMITAGSYRKQTASRKNLGTVIKNMVTPVERRLYLLDHNGEPLVDFEIERKATPVGIGGKSGRVELNLPRFDRWMARFELEIEDDFLDPEDAQEALALAGRVIGIGHFRAECGGGFGRFQVTRWEEITREGAEVPEIKIPDKRVKKIA